MSITASLHHIVISTKYRRMTIPESVEKEMYKVIAYEIKKCGAFCLCINGIGNHIHMLVNFGPYTSRADLMKTVKQNSSLWARKSGKFPLWEGWGSEYYCFSLSFDRKEQVKRYILRQKHHHLGKSYIEEMDEFSKSIGIENSPDINSSQTVK